MQYSRTTITIESYRELVMEPAIKGRCPHCGSRKEEINVTPKNVTDMPVNDRLQNRISEVGESNEKYAV